MGPGLLAVAVLWVLAGCSRRSEPPAFEPPPDTGGVVIDMGGTWAVAAIARLDGDGSLPAADPLATPFLSIQTGQLLSFANGIAYDLRGEPLYALVDPTTPNRTYTNSADGRFWRFEVDFERAEDCTFALRVRAAFGSSGPDTILGFVDVRFASDCPAPAVVRPDPDGLFAVELVRVTEAPAGGR